MTKCCNNKCIGANIYVPRTNNFAGTWSVFNDRNFVSVEDGSIINNASSITYVIQQTGNVVSVAFTNQSGTTYRAGNVVPVYDRFGQICNYKLRINGFINITLPSNLVGYTVIPPAPLEVIEAQPIAWDVSGNPTRLSFTRYNVDPFKIQPPVGDAIDYNDATTGLMTKQ